MSTRLSDTGYLTNEPMTSAPGAGYMEKRALFVYEGDFQSMDGLVTVTKKQLRSIVDNHNSILAKVKRLVTGDIPAQHCQPLQLDHSTSAQVTVGRIHGPLEYVEGYDVDGMGMLRAGILGTVRVLGADNIEKVTDGRWCHLSIGADLDDKYGKLNELSITPFPAAANAHMLKRLGGEVKEFTIDKKIFIFSDNGRVYNHKDQKIGTATTLDEAKKIAEKHLEEMSSARMAQHRGEKIEIEKNAQGKYVYRINGDSNSDDGEFDTEEEAMKAAQAYINSSKAGKLSDETTESTGQKKEIGMYEKLKAYLSKFKKMSDKDAEEKLKKMSEKEKEELSADADKEEKAEKLAAEEKEKSDKLAAEADEKDKEEKAEKLKHKLSAAKTDAIRLVKGMAVAQKTAKIELSKAKIVSKFARLRSEAKISPAEIKGLDFDKMASYSEETINAIYDTYSKREHVVTVGLMGSTQGVSLSAIAKKAKLAGKAQDLEDEIRAQFNSNPSNVKLSKEKDEELQKKHLKVVESDEGSDVDGVKSHDHLKHLKHLKKLNEEGKHAEAGEYLKKHLSGADNDDKLSDGGSEEEEKHLSALATSVEKIENDYKALVKLASEALGITEDDLGDK